MTAGWAALLAGLGLALWPASTRAGRRLGGLGRRGRLAAPLPPSAAVRPMRHGGPVGAVAAAALGGVGVLALGPALGVAVSAGVLTVALPVRGAVLARRRARFDADLATALALLHGELRAGTPAPAALAAAAERAGTAGAVLALDPAAGPEARCLAAAAAVVATTGAAWSEVVGGVVRDVTARAGRRREVGGALAGVRASMLLLAALPALGVLLAAGAGAHPVQFLLGSSTGRALLAVGALLQLVGVATTLALVRWAAR